MPDEKERSWDGEKRGARPDLVPAPDARMAPPGAGAGVGLRHLHPALAVVLRPGNERAALGQADARTPRPTPPGSRTNRLLLLFHLGRFHFAEPFSGATPAASRLRSGV